MCLFKFICSKQNSFEIRRTAGNADFLPVTKHQSNFNKNWLLPFLSLWTSASHLESLSWTERWMRCLPFYGWNGNFKIAAFSMNSELNKFTQMAGKGGGFNWSMRQFNQEKIKIELSWSWNGACWPKGAGRGQILFPVGFP